MSRNDRDLLINFKEEKKKSEREKMNEHLEDFKQNHLLTSYDSVLEEIKKVLTRNPDEDSFDIQDSHIFPEGKDAYVQMEQMRREYVRLVEDRLLENKFWICRPKINRMIISNEEPCTFIVSFDEPDMTGISRNKKEPYYLPVENTTNKNGTPKTILDFVKSRRK